MKNRTGQTTEGVSPKAVGGTAGAGLGGAVAVLVLYLWPEEQPTDVAIAVNTLASAVLAFVGSRIAPPGVVVKDG